MAWLQRPWWTAAFLAAWVLMGVVAFAQRPWPEGAFEPPLSRLATGDGEGTLSLTPNQLMPAQLGTFQLEIEIGTSGIAANGGVLVYFPKAWFTNPVPLVKPMQQTEPNGFHYIGVSTSRAEARLAPLVDNINFAGEVERFCHMVSVRVAGAALRRGDTITVTLANTTAPYIAGTDEVRVAVDADGQGVFKLIPKGAEYTVSSGPPVRIALLAPSQAVVGESAELQVSAFDRHYNPAQETSGVVRISGLAARDRELQFRPRDRGLLRFEWTPQSEGYVFPAAWFDEGSLYAPGGPIRVSAKAPAIQLYWGDLHSHSNLSKDAIGTNDFGYARDVTRLDFFASTEHDVSDGNADSITPAEWEQIKRAVAEFYRPGKFATILAYECSLRNGHHNVFFRGMDGYPWASHRFSGIEKVWELLDSGEAFTIPHHLGIRWGRGNDPIAGPELQVVQTGSSIVGGPQVSWAGPDQPVLRPVLEMYSEHGTSEVYDANDPLAYERVKYTGATSVDGPHYARNAWSLGHHAGVVAASDNHTAHPGLNHTGLTAVYAPELTREAIFDAILGRHSYGTTGERCIVEFEVAGIAMGQQGKASGEISGRVLVVAPSDIRFAEVLRFTPPRESWDVVQRWDAPGNLLDAPFNDPSWKSGSVYYLSAELFRETNGRVSRAWSSPIWIEP